MSQRVLRKYGVQTDIDFDVYKVDGVDLRTDWAPAQADCRIMKDGGAFQMCDNTAVTESGTYSIILTATEMQFASGVLKIVDAATKVFLDKVIIIETYGHASAQHAMDFDDADGSTLTEVGGDGAQLTEAGGDGDHLSEAGGTGDQFSGLPRSEADLTYIHGTALTETAGQLAAAFKKFFDVAAPTATALSLPDALPDAAGGLPVSDAGGLDLDTKLANTNEITAARMGALTDWINGGRLDLILDIIAADTTTDIPALIATAQNDLDTITGGSGVLIDTDAVDADALKADAVDEIWAKAMSDLAQGAPSATASVLVAINWLYEAFRNKSKTTATRITIYKDNTTTELARSTISDDATTFTKGEMATGV
ncbi:hypothetical protein LCGC14_0376750 [marine sediment metagenome]|uniref:Uncharacterized protein n=1 Tax=marine sediment metagenome TaxID=412755 RepID=A0A0F9T9F2_9ZZZZ